MAKAKAPDGEYIGSFLKEKRKEFSQRDAIDQKMYNLYHGDYKQPMPKKIQAEEIKTGYATQFIDRVQGIFTHDEPTFEMEPINEGDKAINQTSAIEEFLNALFPAMQSEAGQPTWDLITQDVLLYGRGVSQMPPAGSIYWKDYPKQGKEEEPSEYNKRSEGYKKTHRLPFGWRHVPAMGAYPEEDDYGLAEIATVEKRTVRRIMREYGEKALKEAGFDSTRPETELSLVKYADRRWLIYALDGKEASGTPAVCRTIEHKCGMVPYSYIKGRMSSSTKPEHQLKSLLYHMYDLVLYMERLLMQKGSAIRLWCWPTLKVQLKADSPLGEDGNPMRKFHVESGGTIELFEGEEASFLVWQGIGPDIDEQIATIQRYLDRMGLASVMYGTTAADASSGYAINTLIQAAQSLFGPIRASLSKGYEELGKLALRNLELLGQKVYVYSRPTDEDAKRKTGWIGLGPDDIKGYYNIKGRVEYRMPQDLAANAMTAMNLTQGDNPLMSMYKARTELLNDRSPDKTEKQILLEKWKRSPEVQQLYIQAMLKELAPQLEAMQQQAQQPPQGPLAPALANLLGQPELAGPMGQPMGGVLGQAGMPMAPGLGIPLNMGPQAPGPQAQVNAAESQYNPKRTGGRPAGAKRQPSGPRMGQGGVP